jgi:hypothetical protein
MSELEHVSLIEDIVASCELADVILKISQRFLDL